MRPAKAARPTPAAAVAAAWLLVGTRATVAQTTGSVDVGVSTVRYDGFLPSGAASVTPALRWDHPHGTVAARGTYLRFESGHRSLQGSVTGSYLPAPTTQHVQGELLASLGASQYLDFASFWHATAEGRLHWLSGDRGGWVGGSGGRTSYGRAPRPVAVAGVGVWVRHRALTIAASGSRSFVGDTAYTDIISTAQAHPGPLLFEASVGARVSSHGGGRGVFGEMSTTLTLGERTALFLSGGRYPTDPISGSVAGRYVSGGVRLRLASPRSLRSQHVAWSEHSPRHDDPAADARLEVRPAADGNVRLVIFAPDSATAVDVAGDFTDWQPVPLTQVDGKAWEAVLFIASGVHRLNVRIDHGDWIVPSGVTRVADDFGEEVGTIAIP